MKKQTMSIKEFMSGDYKNTPEKKINYLKAATSSILPLTLLKTSLASAATTPEAVPVGATEWISAKSLEALAHALDPLVDLMVALSFPVASVIIVGACFFFMLGKPERAWTSIQNAGLGYVLIQIMPLLLNVLKEVGSAI